MTRDGANDLWAVALGGGDARRITAEPTLEWRAAPGVHPGEVLYLVSDPRANDRAGAGIAVLDIARGEHRLVSNVPTSSVAAAGGALYYPNREGTEIRRLRDGHDEVAVVLAAGVTTRQLVASPDGTRLGLLANGGTGSPQICLLELATAAVRCLETGRAANGRPAFSADGTALYYAGPVGVRRVSLRGADEEVLPGAVSHGGIAVAPDGHALVYSECTSRTDLLDTGEQPPRLVVAGLRLFDPTTGPRGEIAYVRGAPEGQIVELRAPDGSVRGLTNPLGGRLSRPTLSHDGRRVAFAVEGPQPGIYVVELEPLLPPRQATDRPGDGDPVWLLDGRLAFARRGNRGVTRTFVVEAGGGEALPIAGLAREPVGRLADGSLLLVSRDHRFLSVWDAGTGRERRPPVALSSIGIPTHLAVSPDGRWLAIQAGDMGQRAYRADLAARRPGPELVWEAAAGQTVGRITVDHHGHVLVTPATWTGEIAVVDAPPGERF